MSEWWKDAVFYHIYPRSFMDSNGDGVGDLAGITSRLGYLKWLGADAIWLSPVYRSPMADFGYDISDFYDIDPLFGTMEDFDRLLAETHRLGMKLVMDQILHTTSSRHLWFVESSSSRTNPKADWYIWKDPAPDGGRPNNWISFFSGKEPDPAWKWVPERGQYYLHMFNSEQCDLNLRNPEVRAELEKVLRFWLDKGVDGFRLDSVCVYFKDPKFRDFPVRSTAYAASSFSALSKYFVDHVLERPENLLALERIRELLDEYAPERVAIGESASEKGIQSYLEFSSPGRLHLAFNFEFLNTVCLDAAKTASVVSRTDSLFDSRAWPCYVLGHHDGERLLSRVNRDRAVPDAAAAKLMAALLLTIRGTPFIYYGEELGMTDTPIPFDRIVDPFGKAVWPAPGRDVCRTPMQWDDGPAAGFTAGEPWLPVNENRNTVNVRGEAADDSSVLAWYRRVIAVRRERSALRRGRQEILSSSDNVLVIRRSFEHDTVLSVLNFANDSRTVRLEGGSTVLAGTHRSSGEHLETQVRLAPLEALVLG